MAEYEKLAKGVVKRTERREVGLFIDGTGLDRATRRLKRRVDIASLVRGVTSGIPPIVSRYYTLIPNEDDARQFAFLDAVARGGPDIVVKRLPPKGITRQVSVDLEMASDIVAFAFGQNTFVEQDRYIPSDYKALDSELNRARLGIIPMMAKKAQQANDSAKEGELSTVEASDQAMPQKESVISSPNGSAKRIIVVVCPSRELAYPIMLIRDRGVDTVTADFGQFSGNDVLKSAAKWIDLSDSETIWRDDAPIG